MFTQEWGKVLNFVTLCYPQRPVFLGSDFNYPGMDWVEFVPDSNCRNISQCRDSIDICRACSLHQVMFVLTRENSVLDLFFASIPDLISSVHVVEAISDRRIVLGDANVAVPEKCCENKPIFYHARANFSEIASIIETSLHHFQGFLALRSVEEKWSLIKAKLIETLNLSVPSLKK